MGTAHGWLSLREPFSRLGHKHCGSSRGTRDRERDDERDVARQSWHCHVATSGYGEYDGWALLSQQIANSLCFVFLGIDQDENLLKAAQASALYSESLDALRSGSVQKEIRKEDNQEILDALRALSESWRPLKNIVNSVLTTREPKDSDLEAIEALNLSVLEDSVRLARLIEGHYGQNELGAEIASTIRIMNWISTIKSSFQLGFCSKRFLINGRQVAHWGKQMCSLRNGSRIFSRPDLSKPSECTKDFSLSKITELSWILYEVRESELSQLRPDLL